MGAAHQFKELRRLQPAARAVRRPFVVDEAARRHQVGDAPHHIIGHRAAHVAMFGPALFVLRPQSVDDESEAARTVALGGGRRSNRQYAGDQDKDSK